MNENREGQIKLMICLISFCVCLVSNAAAQVDPLEAHVEQNPFGILSSCAKQKAEQYANSSIPSDQLSIRIADECITAHESMDCKEDVACVALQTNRDFFRRMLTMIAGGTLLRVRHEN